MNDIFQILIRLHDQKQKRDDYIRNERLKKQMANSPKFQKFSSRFKKKNSAP